MRLGLFDVLAAGSRTSDELAAELALPKPATGRLLAAAVALRLVSRRGPDRYGLGPVGAPLAGNAAIAAMVEHGVLLYGDLRDPVALLRGEAEGTELARYWPYAAAARPETLPPDQVEPYSALMSASQPLVASQVLDACSLEGYACLLDVGGGEGSFLAAAALRAPALRLMLFDLPAVAERARARLAALGLADRAAVFSGDFLSDALPEGADVISLIRVVHDHDDGQAVALLRAIRRVLPVDGTLLVAEPMSGARGAEPVGDAYFGFYLLAMGRGRPRTASELCDLLKASGFGHLRVIKTTSPVQAGLIAAGPFRGAGWRK